MFSRRLKHLFNSTLSIKKMGELFRAAVAGDTVGVTEFLNKYPSAINKKDLLGRTALMQAAFGRHTDIIEILLKRGGGY